ncbi:DUF2461 domain-containing protein [Streptosporangiaceae bacterium NEAU-GS5]|nr:DUF2461 domain-containing protein [Streptosporangiaceae bacterium NEAU-GS5]
MGFTGFPDEAFIFYEGLEADNSKAYWTAHKATYDEAVKAPMLALLDELGPEFGEAHLFRPNRDIRFSKDKSPYKTHLGAYVPSGVDGIGYYVQVGADGLYVGGGWFAQGDQIVRYRATLDDDAQADQLDKILESLQEAFNIGGQRLKTRPQGYPADHPRIELLKYKSLHAGIRFEPEPWVHTPEPAARVRDSWRALGPLVDWLRRNLS